MASLDSSPLASARDDGAPAELSAEEEARLDADPLQRLYDSHRIEAPATLATILGVFTKLVMIQEREDINEYAQEYFEHMKLARAADPKIDFDKFISTQLKVRQEQAIARCMRRCNGAEPTLTPSLLRCCCPWFRSQILEKKYAPSSYDLTSEFSPPATLAPILTAFSAEVIRYQPAGESNLFGFALEYFTAIVDDGTADTFLRKQAKLADEKQKALDLEKKRTQITKEKASKKKLSMN
jgi:hypothetical protein